MKSEIEIIINYLIIEQRNVIQTIISVFNSNSFQDNSAFP